MRFARIVFICAGIWGLAVLTPIYWLVDVTGRHYSAPSEYPHFFYGFLQVALAWQIAFLMIGSSLPAARSPFPSLGYTPRGSLKSSRLRVFSAGG